MRVPMFHRPALAIALLVGLSASSTALAQTRITPPPQDRAGEPATAKSKLQLPPSDALRTPARILVPQPAAGALQLHRGGNRGLRDSGRAALDQPLAGGWALNGFDLRFDNGDHKLRRIGVLGEERFAQLILGDRNGDDPFSGTARLLALPGVRVEQVTADGGGKFEIPLPGRARADSTLVLSGFEFRRTDGTDANLRNIGIWLVPERNVIQVSLTDDQGMDFRGLEATLGAALASTVVPLPGLLESSTVVAGTGAVARGINAKAGPYRGYRVQVQYAWIPNAWIERKGALAGSHEQRRQRPPSRIDALQGFEFTFTNSDHHLLGLGVNGSGGGDVFFQDNNTDDPLQWSVAYLTLKRDE